MFHDSYHTDVWDQPFLYLSDIYVSNWLLLLIHLLMFTTMDMKDFSVESVNSKNKILEDIFKLFQKVLAKVSLIETFQNV